MSMILLIIIRYLDTCLKFIGAPFVNSIFSSKQIANTSLYNVFPRYSFLINIVPKVLNNWFYFSFPIGINYLMGGDKKLREINTFFFLLPAFMALLGLMYIAEIHTSAINLSIIEVVFSIVLVAAIGFKLIPKLIHKTTSDKLKAINKKLKNEVQEREKAEKSLKEHKENLEHLVQQRTLDLENTASKLQKEINEHKEAQAQISLQASLLEQVDSAIVATDLHYNIIYWNQCAQKLFGWKSSEVLGKPALEVMIRKEHRRAGKRFLEKLGKRKAWSGDFTIPHISGRKIPVELSCSALMDAHGKQIGFTCVAVDITDHVRFERKLQREKEKAVRQAHAKQDFLATMSHEIRTPLNVIIGMTRLLNDANPSKSQHEYLKNLEFSANHLLTIINDVLDLAKIDAGKIKLEKISFDVHSVIGGVKNAFSTRAEEKNIDLRLDIDKTLPHRLLGDQVRLTQVLNNLVSNALKFTNEGFVTIRVRVLETKHSKVKLLFEVSDSGIGIHEDKLGQIFENFTQAQEDTTRKYGGTGLGLTICKKLVDLQKGKIIVKSKEEIGSTFSFDLEYELDHSEPIEPENNYEIQYTLQDIRLLLVDDNHANRIVASNFLSKMGVRVDFAENGEQAVHIVQNQEFDIVLMDLQMPIMDGYEATQAIRKLGDTYKDLPIIALTADVVSDVRQKVFDSGMNDYLSKPFKPEQLNTTIAKNLKLEVNSASWRQSSAEQDHLMTLCQILDEYSDDRKFVITLLESLKNSFQQLSYQINETAEQRDLYSLHRIIHKLQPSIKMVENEDLYLKLNTLKEIISKEEINDTEIRLLLDEIHNTSNESVHYLDQLYKKVQNQDMNFI
ncbi:response regulator [Catalinimonas niigatensis]|uniref:response regulator n=1 Tax=Catalinimonas niigatensis TaxID=1397264 RepID=UPI002666A135|nr:response regulator [Catalinimonas niigatensis]WPP52810.1 ATP-binding protein [Catalinimonas niigatensis]